MNRRSFWRAQTAVVVAAICILSAAAAAQDAPDELQPWQVSKEALELQLLPLRQEDLQAEAERWVDLLAAKIAELSAAKIERSRTEDAEALTAIRERITELELEKSALVERCGIVIDAYEVKGGDPGEYAAYVAAVGGLPLDIADADTAIMQFRAWLASEEGGRRWMWAILKFGVILAAFLILALILSAVVRRAVGTIRKTSTLLRDFLGGLTRRLVLLIGVVVAVSALGVDIGPLVAAIGAAGLVIGFALQGTLSNFASGIMILLYRPYDVGHVINAGGVSGKVESMTLVSTTLVTPDNQTIIVPNNSVWGGVITNITGRSTRRVDLTFGISYSDDIDQARAVLQEIVSAHELVLAEPAPVIQVNELANSSVNFVVRPWVNTSDYWTVFWDLQAAVKRRFDRERIGIPFPQMDVHLHQAETTA